MKVNVYSSSYLDQRFKAAASVTTSASQTLYPFYTACWLIPKSEQAEQLVGDYEVGRFYAIEQDVMATKLKGELLKGATCFFNQNRSESGLGVLVFEDKFSLDPLTPDTKTDWIDAPQDKRLSVLADSLGSIGRNAIVVCVSTKQAKLYNAITDDLRLADSGVNYLKIKIVKNQAEAESEINTLKQDMEEYAGTLIVLQEKGESKPDQDLFDYDDRADFVIAGRFLNPYSPTSNSNTYSVGMSLDGTIVNVKSKNVVYNNSKTNIDLLTQNMLTYFQVRADDADEILVAGGGVVFQGSVIPVNFFLLAKYGEYVLKNEMLNAKESSRFGVANATLVNRAISITMTKLEPFRGVLIDTLIGKSYTQSEVNNMTSNSVLKIPNAIAVTALPVEMYEQITFTIGL